MATLTAPEAGRTTYYFPLSTRAPEGGTPVAVAARSNASSFPPAASSCPVSPSVVQAGGLPDSIQAWTTGPTAGPLQERVGPQAVFVALVRAQVLLRLPKVTTPLPPFAGNDLETLVAQLYEELRTVGATGGGTQVIDKFVSLGVAFIRDVALLEDRYLNARRKVDGAASRAVADEFEAAVRRRLTSQSYPRPRWAALVRPTVAESVATLAAERPGGAFRLWKDLLLSQFSVDERGTPAVNARYPRPRLGKLAQQTSWLPAVSRGVQGGWPALAPGGQRIVRDKAVSAVSQWPSPCCGLTSSR